MSTSRSTTVLAAMAVFLLVAAPAPAGDDGEKKALRPLKEVLRGEVLSLKGNEVEVRYDFSDPVQLEDFRSYKPFRVVGDFVLEVKNDALHLRGTGGVVWKPVLKRRAGMDYDVKLKIARDIGSFVSEDRESEHYVMYSIYDQFFQNKDSYGSPKQHMICRFTPSQSDSGGELAFRYISRGTRPAVPTGKPVKIRWGIDGNEGVFEIDGEAMKGKDNWGRTLQGLRPGCYVLDNEAWFSSLTVRGELDPAWAAEAGVDLTVEVKPVKPGKEPVREASAADVAARETIGYVRLGAESATVLLPILENGALLEEVRKDAAAAMGESGDARLVPRLIPLLESEDLATRTLADSIASKLAGRSFGFKPDAPEDKRRKAIRTLLDYIEKNPRKFQ